MCLEHVVLRGLVLIVQVEDLLDELADILGRVVEDRTDVLLVGLLPVARHLFLSRLVTLQVTLLLGVLEELLAQVSAGVRRQETVSWNEVFVNARVAQLITAERLVRDEDVPYANLRAEFLVDLLNDIVIFDNQLQGDNVSRSVDTLVGTRAPHQR